MPDGWRLPVENYREALTSLQVQQTKLYDSRSRPAFIESINSVFQRILEGEDPMATKAPAKPAAKKSAKLYDHSDCLRRLLKADKWTELVANNSTDKVIELELASDWKIGARDESVPCIASSLGIVGVWIGQANTRGKPTLQGHQLFEAVRRAFSSEKVSANDESDNELLRLILKLADFSKLKSGATDEELTVAINRAFRGKHVPAKRKYTTSTNYADHGTAVWLDGINTKAQPTYSITGKGCRPLLPIVRDLFNIPFTDEPTTKATGPSFIAAVAAVAADRKVLPVAKEAEPENAIVIAREIIRKPLKWFVKSPYDTRGERPNAWLQELAQDLKTHGQLQPCLARPDGQHIAGWTRVEAAKLAGLKELDVRIVTCTDTQARRLVLVENAKRRDLTEREKCEAYCALMEEYRSQGRQQKELAHDLGINETTLSNNLRLKSIPPEIWERHEAGGLSTDQVRKIATHADRPLFVKGFLKHLEGTVRDIAQPEPHHFDSAVSRGLNSAFRPMAKDSFGGGRQFKDSELTDELDVVEVEVNGRTCKMAGNVELWNKLNIAAKKKKASAGKADAPEPTTDAKKRQREVEAAKRTRIIARTWDIARRSVILERFNKKLNKADRELLVRLAMFRGDVASNSLTLTEIAGDDEAYTAACFRIVNESFGEKVWIAESDLAGLVKWLQLNPADNWKPTLELLSICSADELKEFATQCEVLAEGEELIPTLLEKWPTSWIPDEFYLEKPNTKKPAKAK